MAGLMDFLSPTSGADPSQNMGLMGMLANPQTAGLLGMAGGLLSAAGPSRLPVTNGMALGGGFQGMQQGIGNAIQNQRAMYTMQAMQGLLGNGSGQSASQPPQGVAPSMSALGGPNSMMPATMGASGSGGTPDGSSASGAPMPQGGSAAPGGGIFGRTPQQLWQQGMLMNMAGIPGGADMMKLAAQYDRSLQLSLPTQLQQNAAAAYGEGTPGYQTALQGAVDKEGIVPLRPGAPYIRGGQVFGTPGQAPQGFMNVPNGDGTWSVQAVSGGPEAVKQSAAAGSIGKAYGNVQTGFVNGQPTFVNTGALADQTSGGASPFGGSNGRYPGGTPAAPGGGNVQPSLAPAESAAQTTMGEKSAAQYAAEQQSAGGFGTRMFNLNKALTGLQNAQTGPGSDSVNTVRSFLMAQGPQVLQSLGIVDPNKIQSYDEANKYLTQYAMNQAGALGEGTDAKLATTLSGNANTHISNLAAQDVVKANMALERMNQAAVNSFSQTGQSPAQYSTWKAQFASRVDPRVFAWNLMDKSKQQAMYNGMNDAQRNQFRTQYNWATQNGFLGQ